MTSTDFECAPVWMREEYQKSRPDGLVIQQIIGFADQTSRFIEALKERICPHHPLLNQMEMGIEQLFQMMYPVQAWTDIRLPSAFIPALVEFNCCNTSVFFTEKDKTQVVSKFVGDGLREFQKEHSLHIPFSYNAKIVKKFYSFILGLKKKCATPTELKEEVKKELDKLSSKHKREEKGEIDITKVTELKDKLEEIRRDLYFIWIQEVGGAKSLYNNYIFQTLFDDDWYALAQSLYVVSSMLPTPQELLYSDIGTKYLKQIDDQLQKCLGFVREGLTTAYKESYAKRSNPARINWCKDLKDFCKENKSKKE